ncbi:hypothetical protein CMUST_07440 [Corynebacterium mustelae]|uniref:Uncharacterized protein n=1 Tax=Corynebacterium mustelae TaxID=571915 RepID=A0A0G3H3Y8_9CORY|nr:hypothetical protein CMUST_07440 [Corynebacterium mustelae]
MFSNQRLWGLRSFVLTLDYTFRRPKFSNCHTLSSLLVRCWLRTQTLMWLRRALKHLHNREIRFQEYTQ